ncbi:MAG: response regulator, partial [Dinghuibacter sp.]|nr:response regulator [Dinghuibacter sp.]
QLQERKKELESTVAARTHELERDKAIIQQQAEELKEADEMKSRFFANVSHELRTPLTLLAGPVNRLLQQTPTGNPDHFYLQLMQQNIQQLQNRVNEILDLSKLEAREMELKETPVQLFGLMQLVTASFESLAQQKNIHFLYRYRAPENKTYLLDAEQLKKVMNNLLSNAIKFTPSGGQVLVTVHETVAGLVIKVADTGEGIHPSEQEYIFNRFYQAKKGGSGLQGGTGIGLALTSELVKLMKGTITVDSEPGRGSTFIVSLPRKETTALPETHLTTEMVPELPLAPAHQPVHNGAHILLVEDNYMLQQYLTKELQAFRVTITGNGAEAWQWLQQDAPLPDLVISDIMMPVMDGFALLEQLKGNERFSKIPVVMLTARADMEDKLNALRIGVDDYLVKPFVTEELLARINNLLTRKQARNNPDWLREEEEPVAGTEPEENHTPVNSAWLKQVESVVLACLDNRENFTLDSLAEKIFISKRQLQRNIKEETGLTANNYIKELRLHRARYYLENKTFGTVAEVSYAVGFNDPHYFSTLFTERYGKKPAEY